MTPFTATIPNHSPCPKCGSQDAKYLSLIYEGGLSSVNTNTHYRRGPVSTTGTVQSASSQRAAPPGKKAYSACLLTLVLGVVFWSSDMALLGVALLLLSLYLGYTAFIFNSRVWPHRYQVWQQSAMCQRCGTIYVPNAAGITLDATSTQEIMAEHQRKLVVAAQPILSRAQDLGGQVAQKAVQKAEELRANAQREAQTDEANQAAKPQSPNTQDRDSGGSA